MSASSSAMVSPPAQLVLSPRRFGQYVLMSKLAEGGMAEIFLAKQVGAEGFERDVVIKCMLEHFSQSPDFVSMFLDEARLAARLHHPNIVQITDLGVADGRYFICMEYLAGEDLETVIDTSRDKGEAIPIAVAARIILSVLEGLEFAHGYQERGQSVGLVHRDISPSNVFVTFQGTVKVLDFGIAKASTRVTHTQPGLLKGKWGYMSPEQARGEVQLDGRSDLFSLGVTFHELLTGRRLFERHHELGVLLALMEQPIPAPSTLRADIPPALDRIVMKALERGLEQRYASAFAMRADLEDFLRTTPAVPGVSPLAQYMQGLFGQETVQRKTKIPSLSELSGLALPPLPEEITGFEKTLVRSASPGETLAEEQRPVLVPTSPPAVEVPPPARGGGRAGVRGVLALVALLGLGAAAAWYFLPLPVSSPPPTVEAPPLPVPPVPSVPSVPVEPEPRPAPTVAVKPEPEQPKTEPEPEPKPVPTPPPPVPVRAPAIQLTIKEVNGVLARHTRSLLACGEQFRAELPEGRRLKIQMTVKNSGQVRNASVSEPDASTLPNLARCLEKQLARMKFPRNTNQPEIRVELPLRFNND